MPGNFATTTRNALRRLLGTSKVSDIDEGFQRLAEDADTKLMAQLSGPAGSRPAAGFPGRIYHDTDTTERGLWRDVGTSWEAMPTFRPPNAFTPEYSSAGPAWGAETTAHPTRPTYVVVSIFPLGAKSPKIGLANVYVDGAGLATITATNTGEPSFAVSAESVGFFVKAGGTFRVDFASGESSAFTRGQRILVL